MATAASAARAISPEQGEPAAGDASAAREVQASSLAAGITAVVGRKRLTIENWREADVTSAQFGRVSPLVGPVPMAGDDWARAFLAVELKAHMPESIRELFDIARGAMLY